MVHASAVLNWAYTSHATTARYVAEVEMQKDVLGSGTTDSESSNEGSSRGHSTIVHKED